MLLLWIMNMGLQIVSGIPQLFFNETTQQNATKFNESRTTFAGNYEFNPDDKFAHPDYENTDIEWPTTPTLATIPFFSDSSLYPAIFNFTSRSSIAENTTVVEAATRDINRIESPDNRTQPTTRDAINLFKAIAHKEFEGHGLDVYTDLGYNGSKNVDPNELVIKWYLRRLNSTRGDIFFDRKVGNKTVEVTGWHLDNLIVNIIGKNLNKTVQKTTTQRTTTVIYPAPEYPLTLDDFLRQKAEILNNLKIIDEYKNKLKTWTQIKLEINVTNTEEILKSLKKIGESFNLNPSWGLHYTGASLEAPVFSTGLPWLGEEVTDSGLNYTLLEMFTRQAGPGRRPAYVNDSVSYNSPFISYLYADMQSRKNGYLTTYYRNLFEIIVHKDPQEAAPLYKSAKIVIKELHANNTLAVFGEPMTARILRFVELISGSHPNAVQSQATRALQILNYRRMVGGSDMNSLLDYADSRYDHRDGLRLFRVLEDLHNFPKISRSPIDLATDVINDALMEPFHRVSTPAGYPNLMILQIFNKLLNRRSLSLPGHRINFKNKSLRINPQMYVRAYLPNKNIIYNGLKNRRLRDYKYTYNRNSEMNKVRFRNELNVKDKQLNVGIHSKKKVLKQIVTSTTETSNDNSDVYREDNESNNNDPKHINTIDNKKVSDIVKPNNISTKKYATTKTKTYKPDNFGGYLVTTEKEIKHRHQKPKKKNMKKLLKHLKRKHPDMYKKILRYHKHRGDIYIKIKRRKHKSNHSLKQKRHYRNSRTNHNYENLIKHRISRKNVLNEYSDVLGDIESDKEIRINDKDEKSTGSFRIAQKRFHIIQETTFFKNVYKNHDVNTPINFKANDKYTIAHASFRHKNINDQEINIKSKKMNPSKDSNLNKVTIAKNELNKSKYLTTKSMHSYQINKKKFKTRKDEVLDKIMLDSSYSDEENCLKMNLYDAFRHENRYLVKMGRRNGHYESKDEFNDLSSYSDNEGVIKNNIYKVFGYAPRD